MAVTQPSQINVSSTVSSVGLKNISEQFREDLLKINLQTPPDIVVGLTDLGGSALYQAYREAEGKDAAIHRYAVNDPGNVLDVATDIRKYLMKRNLQTPSDIEQAIINLSANQSETMRNMGGIGTDATINWRAVVVDAGTVDNAADVTRMANLSRNKLRDLTDPSESNLAVIGEGYNYSSLLQDIGQPAIINNFIIPNFQSVGAPDNPISKEAFKLDVKINKYAPEQYNMAQIREEILNEVYKRTTYVTDYTTTLNNYSNNQYNYFGFYNQNNQGSIDTILNGQVNMLAEETPLMNVAAYMLNYNLQQRFEQNLYTETLGRINLVNQNYQSQFPPSLDPLELIKIAKDPMDNIWEKNFTITVPRNFVSKAAQFVLGLEGVVSPFDLWESVDLRKDDLTPSCEVTSEGIQALNSLDPTAETITNAKANVKKTTKREDKKLNDDYLLGKTGGGQRWALYENLNMNKYSPKFDTPAELLGFTKKPKGVFYLGSETSPPIELLQVGPAFNLINNNVLAQTFNKGFDDPKLGGYGKTDMLWANDSDNTADPNMALFISSQVADKKSTAFQFRGCSLLDITQKLLHMGGVDSPIRNLKTKFRDGDMVYSKGNAVRKIEVNKVYQAGNTYKVLDPWEDGFCRTWTKGKQYSKVSHLVRYGELIRRERNSVIDRNANYNIFPTKLNVGTLYGQKFLAKDGVKDRFADKHFDEERARKYMFSIENLAWKDNSVDGEKTSAYAALPTYEKGSNGGRVMWFPPYGLSFNETSAANWTKHDFLGRPEPIYTYNNTERSGTLSWLIIVDHPTILNVLVQKELAKYTDEEVDAILAAFWAGCVEYDIFELAAIWGKLSAEDIDYFKKILEGHYPYPANVTKPKADGFNITVSEETKPNPPDTSGTDIEKLLKGLIVFFPNDEPKPNVDTKTVNYETIYAEYLKWLTVPDTFQEGGNGCPYDYVNTIGDKAPTKYFLQSGTDKSQGIDIREAYKAVKDAIVPLKTYIDGLNADQILDIEIQASASTLAEQKPEYNRKLAVRRAYSVVNWFAGMLGGMTVNVVETADKSFKAELIPQGSTEPKIVIHGNYDNLNGKSVDQMYNDVNWGVAFDATKKINITQDGTAKVVDATVEKYKSDKCDDSWVSVLSYPASYARRVQFLAVTKPKTGSTTKQTTATTPKEKEEAIYVDGYKSTGNVLNKRDIATRILNKLIGENEYFDYLSESSPVVFDSLKEKLKYFSPAFHSMTPEGLNSRLTFLQQCMRPGKTVEINKDSNNNAVNMSFGRPPVCILRIGDFFNTKMIIENLTIDYNVVGSSITYDLNPEGIGAQPMLAKVSLTVKYIGGAGLREPVAQLQNALSFNYYANADIYESSSYGQTNLDERYLENLELAYDSTELDIAQLDWKAYKNVIPDPQNNYTYLGTIVQSFPMIDSSSPDYIPEHAVNNTVDVVQYHELNYQPLFKRTYDSYTSYLNSYTSVLDKVTQSSDPYNFMWVLYGGMVHSPDYRRTKGFDTAVYPYANTNSGVPSYRNSNYFELALDSFNKSNNVADTRLHLYPQEDTRIVDSSYNLETFAGVALPKYFKNIDISQKLNAYKWNFYGYLGCEEWAAFTPDVLKAFDNMTVASQYTFRTFTQMAFVTYYDKMIGVFDTDFGTNYDAFNDCYQNILATNAICCGVDSGTMNDTAKYLEVVPNKNSSDDVDFKTIFGTQYDVLKDYPYPLNTTSKASFKNMALKPTTDGTNGMFNYLRDQLEDPQWQPHGKFYYDFAGGQWMKNGSATPTSGSTVFEKLNYERLYFANLATQAFIKDGFAATSKEFTIKNEDRDFSTLSDIRKGVIRGALYLSNTDNKYTRKLFNYTGSTNSTFSSHKHVQHMQTVSVENILFFSFIKNFTSAENIKALSGELYALYPDNATNKDARTKIDTFLKKLQAKNSVVNDLDKAIKVYTTEAAKLVKQTATDIKAVTDTIAKGAASDSGYKLKMFEKQGNLVNARGRDAIKAYYKSLWENPKLVAAYKSIIKAITGLDL